MKLSAKFVTICNHMYFQSEGNERQVEKFLHA